MMAPDTGGGFVVDDAIVVLKTLFATWKWQEAPGGGLRGRPRDCVHIVSMTLSLTSVFIRFCHERHHGRMFHEFAVVISVAILISGFVSLSLTPMMCSRSCSLRPRNTVWPTTRSSGCLKGCGTHTKWSLNGVIRHRALTMVVSARQRWWPLLRVWEAAAGVSFPARTRAVERLD